MDTFCRELPKVELHAHLNGSLSRSTIAQLKRHYADIGIEDRSNAFFDEFQYGDGDITNLAECFKEFALAHSLTTTIDSLSMATKLTLQEFSSDGCCYVELRSTPRDTQYMTKKEYIETLIHAIQEASSHLNMFARLIISINRSSPCTEAKIIADFAIEYHKKYPDVVVGIELSGEPTVGEFKDFVPVFTRARDAGLKVTLHCGEVCNSKEVLEMLNFKPDRIGHGTCIHPTYGGSEETWKTLCENKVPVEVCLTSNIKTKTSPDYESHHFKMLRDAGIPAIICTDDKGIFNTSLSQEYMIVAEIFNFDERQIAQLALDACQYVFAEDLKHILSNKVLNFLNKNK